MLVFRHVGVPALLISTTLVAIHAILLDGDTPASMLMNQVQMPFAPTSGSSTFLPVMDFQNLSRLLASSGSTNSLAAADDTSSRSFWSNLSHHVSWDSITAWIAAVAQKEGPVSMVIAVALTDSIPLAPTQPMAMMAGAVFGLKMGLAAVILGQTIATVFAIAVGRYILAKSGNSCSSIRRSSEYGQEALPVDDEEEGGGTTTNTSISEEEEDDPSTERKLETILAELACGLNSEDWKTVFVTVFLARQSPVLPFSLGNYFIGASTSAPILPCTVATVVSCLPMNVLLVGAGAGGMAAIDMAQGKNGLLVKGLEAIGVIVTAVMILALVRVVVRVWTR